MTECRAVEKDSLERFLGVFINRTETLILILPTYQGLDVHERGRNETGRVGKPLERIAEQREELEIILYTNSQGSVSYDLKQIRSFAEIQEIETDRKRAITDGHIYIQRGVLCESQISDDHRDHVCSHDNDSAKACIEAVERIFWED